MFFVVVFSLAGLLRRALQTRSKYAKYRIFENMIRSITSGKLELRFKSEVDLVEVVGRIFYTLKPKFPTNQKMGNIRNKVIERWL